MVHAVLWVLNLTLMASASATNMGNGGSYRPKLVPNMRRVHLTHDLDLQKGFRTKWYSN